MSQTKEYKVIRSYERGTGEFDLNEAFRQGWQLEHASEYIPPRKAQKDIYTTKEYFGYIEYILSRPIKTS